ncbi:LEAF RUST 10 DISEASE-RESISTANCE LOCUS RECEPTOR-LIKE PROTEIN KINASE-like 2.1 isoform X2 [Trifolium pratense]|uniref:LEAF RUST 10 DISEASE-RESISTANCE LOCUS RECEPTOR-LIKE PROTEIN KINASE-like 2.1 isoform X2 n=1 Tax=Trifolium pratense TaxID=57577 RepID=UPI001E6928D6|nr:LEAF RUST 10 DISEASE-RESISTANCE LOCUS RECEPTOR-LIKE PROTEIN KINASE-like 2.1 isoform X2 [Trifolium pratense]
MSRRKSFSCSAESISLLWFLQIVMVVIVILQHHHHQTCDASTITITNNQTYCPPSSCGKITNIKPPFRLKNDPTTCGDPRYELACENNMTMLTLFSGKYYVKSIDYEDYTIQLVDPGIAEGDCSSIPRYFLTESNFTYNYPIDSNRVDPYEISYYSGYGRGHIIYLKCSKPVKNDPKYVDTSPCGVNSDSKSYVYAAMGYLKVESLRDYCKVKLVAMTYSADNPNRSLSYKEIYGMLQNGFELSWFSGACKQLCGDNQICEYPNSNLKCQSNICSYPMGADGNCDQMSKLRILAEGALQVIGITKTYTLYKVIGNTKTDASSKEDVSISKIGIEIGRITGKYILPSYIVRFVMGLIVFFVLLINTCRRRHISIYESIEVFLRANTLIPIRYSYKEIKMMTGSFRAKLGEGGFGAVFKGKLRSGPFVAVKVLGKSKGNGQDFINEVATIGRIHHTNVVRLTGFCIEESKRALIYEFMSNGSLDKYISSKEDTISLTYKQMYEISLGVARGIAYLHEGCNMQILHFDIKPHNILLDENFIPKVSDFGLAKLYPNDIRTVPLTAARGTIGYMAPELFYKNIGGVSYKADVYSFGMLLMEMASKKRNSDQYAERSSGFFYPIWVYDQLNEEKEIEMDELTSEEMINVKKMFITALWCVQLKPIDRPSMNKVIEMLEGNIENIDMPPKPSLYSNETIQNDREVTFDEIESDADDDSVSLLKETNS